MLITTLLASIGPDQLKQNQPHTGSRKGQVRLNAASYFRGLDVPSTSQKPIQLKKIEKCSEKTKKIRSSTAMILPARQVATFDPHPLAKTAPIIIPKTASVESPIQSGTYLQSLARSGALTHCKLDKESLTVIDGREFCNAGGITIHVARQFLQALPRKHYIIYNASTSAYLLSLPIREIEKFFNKHGKENSSVLLYRFEMVSHAVRAYSFCITPDRPYKCYKPNDLNKPKEVESVPYYHFIGNEVAEFTAESILKHNDRLLAHMVKRS